MCDICSPTMMWNTQPVKRWDVRSVVRKRCGEIKSGKRGSKGVISSLMLSINSSGTRYKFEILFQGVATCIVEKGEEALLLTHSFLFISLSLSSIQNVLDDTSSNTIHILLVFLVVACNEFWFWFIIHSFNHSFINNFLSILFDYLHHWFHLPQICQAQEYSPLSSPLSLSLSLSLSLFRTSTTSPVPRHQHHQPPQGIYFISITPIANDDDDDDDDLSSLTIHAESTRIPETRTLTKRHIFTSIDKIEAISHATEPVP